MLAALLSSGGCASLKASLPSMGTANSAQRSYQENIQLTGRLSVRYQANGQDQALHGSFNWEQGPARTTVTLLSPLGQTVAIIKVTPNGASLEQSGQAPRTAADVDTLTAQTLGWPLPVASMREWLQGFVITQGGKRVAVASGTEQIISDGWQIRYANWTEFTGSPLLHPKRIDLNRNTAQAGEVAIRIVIDTWQTP